MGSKDSTVKAITRNPRYRQLLQAIADDIYDFPFEDTLKEIQNLHNQLLIRKLTSKSLQRGQQKQLLAANLQNQAYRSRIIEILVQARQYSANLHQEYDLVRNYLLQKYPEHFKEYRTKEERLRMTDSLFEPVITLLNKFQTLEESSKMVIEDLDRAAWSIKSTLDILSLSSRREYNV